MSAKSNTLEVSHLGISFTGTIPFHAVSDISFSLSSGQTLAIVGESGSGKTLTALSLAGLLPKNAVLSGDISLESKEGLHNLSQLSEYNWQKLRGNTIGMIFQEPMSALNPVMKVGKQLRESILCHRHLSKKEAKAMALSWLEKVKLPQPERIYNRYPHQLSGGQKQRVMIAMAMCCSPTLLIADEPTTALDTTVQKEIVLLMKELQAQGNTAMVFITHDLALAMETADKILVMYRGACIEYGSAQDVMYHPQHPYTKALIACRPSVKNKGKRLPVVSDFTEGHNVTTGAMLPENIITDNSALQVKDLRIWFPENKNLAGKTTHYFKAVDGVSFNLLQGETLGLVGESGCGKSTVTRAIMGLSPVRSGEIWYKNKDLSKLKQAEWKQVRRNIQLIFQDPYASLNPRMTIGDIISEPLLLHHIVPREQTGQETKRLLDCVQLPASAARLYPHQFSGGQRQRIGIARALALRPDVLICDESVSALDVSVQAQVLNLLKDLQREFSLSYLFISHDLSVVHYMSDRVLVMKAGEIVEERNAEQILTKPQHPYTQRLVAAIPGTDFRH